MKAVQKRNAGEDPLTALKDAVEASGEAIFITDRNGTITYVNPEFTRMYGYKAGEVVGKMTPRILKSGVMKKGDYRKFWATILSGNVVRGELINRTKDGRLLNIDGSANPIAGRDGKITGFFAVQRDTTRRKKAEDALRESEGKLRAVVNGSPIPMFVIDRNHKIIYWNPALERLSGLPAKDMLGTKSHWKAFYPKKRPCIADLLVEGKTGAVPGWYSGKYRKSGLVAGGYEATDFFPSLGKNGKWLRFTAAPIRDAAGGVAGALETLEDITERKGAEEALRESEERYRGIFELSPETILVLDGKGTVTDINGRVLDTVGYRKEEVVGRNILELPYVPVSERARLLKNFLGRLAGKSIPPYEVRFVAKDRRDVFGIVAATAVKNDRGETTGEVVVVADVTARRKGEDALKESEEKYRALAVASPDCVKLFGLDGKLRYMNPAGMREHGLKSQKEVAGWDFMLCIENECRGAMKRAFAEAKRGRTATAEARHVPGMATSEWCMTTLAPVRDASGKVVSVFGVSRDITEQKKADEFQKSYLKRLEREVSRRTEELRRRMKELKEKNRQLEEFKDFVVRRENDLIRARDEAMRLKKLKE